MLTVIIIIPQDYSSTTKVHRKRWQESFDIAHRSMITLRTVLIRVKDSGD